MYDVRKAVDFSANYLPCLLFAEKKSYPAECETRFKEGSEQLLIYVISGHIIIRNRKQIFSVPAGYVCRFDQTSETTLSFDTDSELFITRFTGSVANNTNALISGKPLKIEDTLSHSVIFYFERLLKEKIHNNEELNTGNLSDLLTLLSDIYGKTTKQVKKVPMQALSIREYIRMHYREQISLDSLSDVFHINKFQICRKFKEAFSISVLQYQFELRLVTASELLKNTDMTINEISCYLGFDESSSMIRLFKKKYCCTPGSFRKSSQLLCIV